MRAGTRVVYSAGTGTTVGVTARQVLIDGRTYAWVLRKSAGVIRYSRLNARVKLCWQL